MGYRLLKGKIWTIDTFLAIMWVMRSKFTPHHINMWIFLIQRILFKVILLASNVIGRFSRFSCKTVAFPQTLAHKGRSGGQPAIYVTVSRPFLFTRDVVLRKSFQFFSWTYLIVQNKSEWSFCLQWLNTNNIVIIEPMMIQIVWWFSIWSHVILYRHFWVN